MKDINYSKTITSKIQDTFHSGVNLKEYSDLVISHGAVSWATHVIASATMIKAYN